MILLRVRVALMLCAVLAGAACRRAETWGFVATLGNDTTSVERITRRGDHITGEAVGRSPVVVHRTWEATVAPDGSLLRWSMDSHLPSAPAGQTDLHHELIFTGNRVRQIRRAGGDSVDQTYTNGYARMVPWNAFLYATTEQLFLAARGLSDTAKIGQYFFEGWEEGHFGYAQVRHLPAGDVSISSTGLAGSGVAHLDAAGRMLSYSGEGTTYKQEVRRVAEVPDIPALVERYAAAERSGGLSRWLSRRDTLRASLGGVAITVDYGRPLARGRTLVGGLIPYGEVWRTGANAATQITFSAPVRMAGVPLRAGTYTLWTLPSQGGVQLIINGESGQWGTEYDAGRDIARRPMDVSTADAPVEAFTIRVDSAASRLVMEWGRFRWSVPIVAA